MEHDGKNYSGIDLDDGRSMVGPCQEGVGETEGDASAMDAPVFWLAQYADNDILTREGMCQVFKCAPRTVFRMAERFEIPPPTPLAGRSVWVVGRLKAWIIGIAQSKEEEALREAKRLKILK